MDGQRFDRIAVAWSRGTSRRRVVSGFGAAALGFLGIRGASAQVTLQRCGGMVGSGCPVGMVCVDDPIDSCNPSNGDRDCPGVCAPQQQNPCATLLCQAGTTCCPRNGGFCIADGGQCDEGPAPAEVKCGSSVCASGEYCCNPSCGICRPMGQGCTREFCSPVAMGGSCGPNVCAPGEVCCNESCGICTPPDGFCTQQFCF